MAWQEQLEALGLDNSNMPNMIKKAIKDLYDYQNALERNQKILERDDLSDRKREEIEEEVEVLEQSIETQEEVIEKKIAQWEKNKDGYEARAKKLMEAAQARKGGKVAKAVSTPASSPAAPEGVVNVTPAPEPTPVVADPPKKKGGWGWIAVGLVVAVLTAGAVIINKDE